MYRITKQHDTFNGKLRVNWPRTTNKTSKIEIIIKAKIPKIGKITLENFEIVVGKFDVAITGIDLNANERSQVISWIQSEFTESLTKSLKKSIEGLLVMYALPNSKRIAMKRQKLGIARMLVW